MLGGYGMTETFFKYQHRLNVLQIDVRIQAVKYAEKFYRSHKCSKEEALEKGIVKAEMELRSL